MNEQMVFKRHAVLFAVILGAAMVLPGSIHFPARTGKTAVPKTLRITIPEDLNYTELFDDLMEKYTSQSEVVSVKTTNMGSLFKLTYHITLKDSSQEKEFIDELRCRNGNLEISIAYGLRMGHFILCLKKTGFTVPMTMTPVWATSIWQVRQWKLPQLMTEYMRIRCSLWTAGKFTLRKAMKVWKAAPLPSTMEAQ